MSARFDAVYSELSKLAEPELRLINQQCVSLLRQRYDLRQFEAAVKFKAGDVVTFQSKRHGPVVITLSRVNMKSLVGRTKEGVQWRVSPALCKKVSK